MDHSSSALRNFDAYVSKFQDSSYPPKNLFILWWDMQVRKQPPEENRLHGCADDTCYRWKVRSGAQPNISAEVDYTINTRKTLKSVLAESRI